MLLLQRSASDMLLIQERIQSNLYALLLLLEGGLFGGSTGARIDAAREMPVLWDDV